MKKLFAVMCFLILFVPFASRTEIIEENKISKTLADVDKDTIVVFDIDSTTLEAAQTLGSDPWYYITREKMVSDGMSKDEAREALLKQWMKIQVVTEVEPVESGTPDIIRKLQDQGIKVVALTARPFDLMDVTIRQLNSVGVDFSRNPFSKKDFDIKLDGERAKYFKGVIFCGGGAEVFYEGGLKSDKGVILNRALKMLGYSPKKIIFLDDRKNNVEAVDKALVSNGIECKCIRYGAADPKYKEFDPKIANIETEFFGKALSDDAAKAILKFGSKKR